MKPGGILKPRLGYHSKLRQGGKIPGKKARKKPKRQNKGKPPLDAPPRPNAKINIEPRVGAVAERLPDVPSFPY